LVDSGGDPIEAAEGEFALAVVAGARLGDGELRATAWAILEIAGLGGIVMFHKSPIFGEVATDGFATGEESLGGFLDGVV
jgi:hypothetical protein